MTNSTTQVSGTIPPARVPGSVCVNCGVCCAGVIFGAALLRSEEEREKALFFELPVRKRRGTDEDHFLLPCSYLEDCRCSIYESRFITCRTYECDLLQGLRNGTVAYEEADALTAQVRRRVEEIERHLAPLRGGENLWQRIRAQLNAPESEDLAERTCRLDLLQKARALAFLLRRHFESSLNAGVDEGVPVVQVPQTPVPHAPTPEA